MVVQAVHSSGTLGAWQLESTCGDISRESGQLYLEFTERWHRHVRTTSGGKHKHVLKPHPK